MPVTRRTFVQSAAASAASPALSAFPSLAQTTGIAPEDRVFICNEDSNTLAVIDPRTNTIETTVNLTSFDEDPRPPFRLVTGGVVPPHAAMIHKPLYHGAIDIHGAAPSPDSRLIATTGRGSSNVYLIDTATKRVIGNTRNPVATPTTNGERITDGILVGREPHEPTFTRNGLELWVTIRGESRIAVVDVAAAVAALKEGRPVTPRFSVSTIEGPAQAWFSADGSRAFVISQKVPLVDVFALDPGADGFSRPRRLTTLDIRGQDPFGFTPFQKTTADGQEVWMSHKLADRVSAVESTGAHRTIDVVLLGELARPNHIEFIENAHGRAAYVSLARVDDGGPGGVASSRIAVIDCSAPPGSRKVVGTFFTHGREAHGLWTNPEATVLYVAHEQDELPNTPAAGQTVCTAFDVTDLFAPRFIAQIPLGELKLPSGALRNKKSINLVYVRPGARSQTA
ncbi:MAG TPA: YncE family protein [Alphaproteobacteria bacterium]|nr:YncE family protein [Alphaproteobacteria bacterium]